MKIIQTVASVAIMGTLALANPLADAAKQNGLQAIPESTAELMKYINSGDDPITDAKVELGKMLYFDPRLSRSNLISCNTCHNLALGGVDLVPAAIGHKWTMNPAHLNSPTVYNSVLSEVQFWDGRSPHLEDQAQGPMQAGPEMAAPKDLVVARVTSIPKYVELFKRAYGPNVKIDFERIASVIGVFERTLVTPSRFDDFLNGHDDALTKAEKDGFQLFLDKGCASCHNGMALGGTMQPFQVAAQYSFVQLGGFEGDENGMVKTPTLRNITETAPYFHNGAMWKLTDAIKEMGSTQLGISINDKEAASIATFLGALEGRKPQIVYPVLPGNTDKTPPPTFD
jgi:cytochrome c peroxidase